MTQEQPEGEKKKLVLTPRKKVAVDIDGQTLYVRHLSVGDIRLLSPLVEAPEFTGDLRKLGEAAIKCLASTSQDAEDRTALDDSLFKALSESDLSTIARTIADVSNLGPLPDGLACDVLGAAIKQELEQQSERLAKIASDFKQSVDKSFGSISESVRSALTDNMVGMSAIQEALRSTSALESLRKQYSDLNSPGASTLSAALAASALKIPTASESLRQAIEKSSFSNSAAEALARGRNEHEPMEFINVRPIELPDPEKSPMGRAARASEETARQVQEVAGLTAAMAAQIGELSQTIVTRAIPEWLNKIEGDRLSAQATLEQARDSLKWTKWAVTVSVVMTVAMTGWQVWLASEYKKDNDEQQEVALKLMSEQLKNAEALNRQLAADAKSYREEIAAVRAAVAGLGVLKAIPTPNDKSAARQLVR
ncbi:MAG: hypothetical protein D3M94_05685 [Rhodocyclales bacterium GT-UBC]|nr:MAG: hypothetical protein D3M94_05685 [Rhodocyclales bacterium GT-UBC]